MSLASQKGWERCPKTSRMILASKWFQDIQRHFNLKRELRWTAIALFTLAAFILLRFGTRSRPLPDVTEDSQLTLVTAQHPSLQVMTPRVPPLALSTSSLVISHNLQPQVLYLQRTSINITDEVINLLQHHYPNVQQSPSSISSTVPASLVIPHKLDDGSMVDLRFLSRQRSQPLSVEGTYNPFEARDWIIMLNTVVTDELRQKLKEAIVPCELGDYIPSNAFLTYCTEPVLGVLLTTPKRSRPIDQHPAPSTFSSPPHISTAIRAIMEVHPIFKMSLSLEALSTPGPQTAWISSLFSTKLYIHINTTKSQGPFTSSPLHSQLSYIHSLTKEDEDVQALVGASSIGSHPPSLLARDPAIILRTDQDLPAPDHAYSLLVQLHSDLLSGTRPPWQTVIEELKKRIPYATASAQIKVANYDGTLLRVTVSSASPACHDLLLSSSGPLLCSVASKLNAFTIARQLASLPSVAWVETLSRHKTLNHHATYISQSGIVNKTPLWDKGLRGEGHTVAVADTGVDHDNCYFHDVNVSTPINTFNPLHRKIVAYLTNTKISPPDRFGGDQVDGHGTHTAGTVAGEPPQGAPAAYTRHQGLAPRSKIVVFDYQGPNSKADDMVLPEDIYNEYLTKAYAYGVRVTSNSWGDQAGMYDSFARAADLFTWHFPDLVNVFACGNTGTLGRHTIASPALSKNVIAVGSTHNSPLSFVERGLDAAIRVDSAAPRSGLQLGETIDAEPAKFGVKFTTMTKLTGTRAVVAVPSNGCERQTRLGRDALIMVVRRGSCSFSLKAANAQRAGARLLIVVNNKATPPDAMYPSQEEGEPAPSAYSEIAAVMISDVVGDRLIDAAFDPSGLFLSAPVPAAMGTHNEFYLSSFSSRGPTRDGRIKPDVVAPGEFILSARSDGNVTTQQCNLEDGSTLKSMQGTSMAAPVTAASAVLIREYFMKGLYPGMQGHSFTPSAALVKALLVHSTVPVGGPVRSAESESRYESVHPPPSIYQGFGRFKLDNVLTFSENGASTTIQPSVHIVDHINDEANISYRPESQGTIGPTPDATISTGQTKIFCYNATELVHSVLSLLEDSKLTRQVSRASAKTGFPLAFSESSPPYFRATLAYSDYPASLLTSHYLVNDLDLSLVLSQRRPNGTITLLNLLVGNEDASEFEQAGQDVMDNVPPQNINRFYPDFVSTTILSTPTARNGNGGESEDVTRVEALLAAERKRRGKDRGLRWDNTNNVEGVILRASDILDVVKGRDTQGTGGPSDYTIGVLVHGRSVPRGPQPFSLVVSTLHGHNNIIKTLLPESACHLPDSLHSSATPPPTTSSPTRDVIAAAPSSSLDPQSRTMCPSDCSGHGTCLSTLDPKVRRGTSEATVPPSNTWGCLCKDDYAGAACDKRARPINVADPIDSLRAGTDVTVQPGASEYLYIYVPPLSPYNPNNNTNTDEDDENEGQLSDNSLGLTFTFVRTSELGDADYFILGPEVNGTQPLDPRSIREQALVAGGWPTKTYYSHVNTMCDNCFDDVQRALQREVDRELRGVTLPASIPSLKALVTQRVVVPRSKVPDQGGFFKLAVIGACCEETSVSVSASMKKVVLSAGPLLPAAPNDYHDRTDLRGLSPTIQAVQWLPLETERLGGGSQPDETRRVSPVLNRDGIQTSVKLTIDMQPIPRQLYYAFEDELAAALSMDDSPCRISVTSVDRIVVAESTPASEIPVAASTPPPLDSIRPHLAGAARQAETLQRGIRERRQLRITFVLLPPPHEPTVKSTSAASWPETCRGTISNRVDADSVESMFAALVTGFDFMTPSNSYAIHPVVAESASSNPLSHSPAASSIPFSTLRPVTAMGMPATIPFTTTVLSRIDFDYRPTPTPIATTLCIDGVYRLSCTKPFVSLHDNENEANDNTHGNPGVDNRAGSPSVNTTSSSSNLSTRVNLPDPSAIISAEEARASTTIPATATSPTTSPSTTSASSPSTPPTPGVNATTPASASPPKPWDPQRPTVGSHIGRGKDLDKEALTYILIIAFAVCGVSLLYLAFKWCRDGAERSSHRAIPQEETQLPRSLESSPVSSDLVSSSLEAGSPRRGAGIRGQRSPNRSPLTYTSANRLGEHNSMHSELNHTNNSNTSTTRSPIGGNGGKREGATAWRGWARGGRQGCEYSPLNEEGRNGPVADTMDTSDYFVSGDEAIASDITPHGIRLHSAGHGRGGGAGSNGGKKETPRREERKSNLIPSGRINDSDGMTSLP